MWGGGITVGGGGGKFNSRLGMEEILYDTLKLNIKKLKCFGLLSLFKNKFLNQMQSLRY